MSRNKRRKRKEPLRPRRKRTNRAGRLRSARSWVASYRGKHVVRSYANWYGVDELCAVFELRHLGVTIDPVYVEQLQCTAIGHQRACERRAAENQAAERNAEIEREREGYGEWWNEDFAHIAGFTSGGFAYGVPREEMEAAGEFDGGWNCDEDDLEPADWVANGEEGGIEVEDERRSISKSRSTTIPSPSDSRPDECHRSASHPGQPVQTRYSEVSPPIRLRFTTPAIESASRDSLSATVCPTRSTNTWNVQRTFDVKLRSFHLIDANHAIGVQPPTRHDEPHHLVVLQLEPEAITLAVSCGSITETAVSNDGRWLAIVEDGSVRVFAIERD
ncbi:MAG: hypothetical protein H6834_15610 [Planctomycetes bacterium]|nr:hypothetical protein [Planctomycetota bacterium]